MFEAVLVMLFQSASGAPEQAAQAQAPAPVAAPAEEEPKMVCRRESITGSNKKERVCRPAGQKQDETDRTALQRALDRQGDVLPPSSGFGN